MKVYYLSITSFSDVDMGIMHHIREDVDLTYGVIIQKRNANYTQDELATYCKTHHIDFEPYKMSYNLRDPRCLFIFSRILSSIRRKKPSIVYMVAIDNIYLTLLSLRLSRSRTIVALHDVEFHSNTAFAIPLAIARWITMKYFRNFQVYSREQLQIFKRLYPGKKVSFIPLPLKDFGEHTGPASQHNKVRFLFFGNILHYKGLDVLLKAIDLMNAGNTAVPFELVVAGRCSDWDITYEPLITHKDSVIKHIRFVGNDEVAGFFQEADYLVLPYRDATQSGPLKIAFHYNLPVIASDIGSFREEVSHDTDGYLFKNGDVEDLGKVLLQVLKNHENKYHYLKESQLRYVKQHYSLEKLKQSFLQLLDDTLNKK